MESSNNFSERQLNEDVNATAYRPENGEVEMELRINFSEGRWAINRRSNWNEDEEVQVQVQVERGSERGSESDQDKESNTDQVDHVHEE